MVRYNPYLAELAENKVQDDGGPVVLQVPLPVVERWRPLSRAFVTSPIGREFDRLTLSLAVEPLSVLTHMMDEREIGP